MFSIALQIIRSVFFAAALTSPALAAGIEWDSRVNHGTLDNGLSYFVYDSGKADDAFNISLIVHAGSVDEDGPGGIAHILEHMAFRKSRNHPEGIHQYIDSLGWRQGVQINAVTRENLTQFMIRTRPDDALNLSGSLALMHDLVFGASLTPEDWENERAVILEELEHSNRLVERISSQKKDVLRVGSRYVGRTTIGTRALIEQATIDDIRSFHRKFYVASNMTLVISGNVSPIEAQETIRSLFGGEASVPKPNRDYLDFPLKEGLSVGKVQDAAGVSPQTVYAFRMAMPDRMSDAGQLAYLEKYFLDKLIRQAVRKEETKLRSPVKRFGFVAQETTNERLILAFSASSPDHEAALSGLLEVIERIKREGFDQGDFESVLANARGINSRSVQSARRRAYTQWGDRIVDAILTGSVVGDPKARFDRAHRLLERITLHRLNERMREVLSSPDQVIVFQVPGNVKYQPPSREKIEQARDAVAAETVPSVPLSNDVEPAVRENRTSGKPPEWPNNADVPHSGKLVSERAQTDPNIIEWNLSNGDRVIWLVRDTPTKEVYISGRSEKGFMNDSFSSTVSQAAIQLWSQSGFRFWTQVENERWNGARSVTKNWNFALKEQELDVAAAMPLSAIPEMLEDYSRRVSYGTVRQEAVEAFRSQSISHAAAGDDYERLLYGDITEDPSDVALSISENELQTAATQLLSEPVTWFAVGPAPDEAAKTAFVSVAGAIQRDESIEPAQRYQKDGTHMLRTGTAARGRSTIRMSFFAPVDWTPEGSFLLSTLTPLTQKALKDELRYRLGGIYTLSFELRIDPTAERVVGTLSFQTRSDRALELVDAAQKVFTKMPENVKRADVDRIRSDIRYAEHLRLEDPNTWLRRLSLSYRRYDDAGYIQRADGLADRLSNDLLASYANNVFRMENVAVLIQDR